MAQGAKEPSPPVMQARDLQEAAEKLASAVRYHAEHTATRQRGENRRVLAGGIIAWANLEFAALVLGQASSGTFDLVVAGAGAAVFVLAYIVAIWIMKGGKAS